MLQKQRNRNWKFIKIIWQIFSENGYINPFLKTKTLFYVEFLIVKEGDSVLVFILFSILLSFFFFLMVCDLLF